MNKSVDNGAFADMKLLCAVLWARARYFPASCSPVA